MWVIKLSKHYHSHNDDENVELSSKLSSFGGFQIQCECFFSNCVQNWTFGLNLAVLFFKAQCVGFRVIYEDLLAEMKYSINYNFIFIYLFLLPSNSFVFFSILVLQAPAQHDLKVRSESHHFFFLHLVRTAASLTKYNLLHAVCIQLEHTTSSWPCVLIADKSLAWNFDIKMLSDI